MKVTAVIFDLDGTLTLPYLDFDEIRAEIGHVEGPLLEAMEEMDAERRQRAETILHRHEQLAAENAQLNGEVHRLFDYLRGTGRQIGLVTRNQRRSVDHICEAHNLAFDAIITREDGPVKPDPFPVSQVCAMLGVKPEQAVVVGDYVFDLISARRAGAWNILFCSSKDHPNFADEADYIISSLGEIPALIDDIERENPTKEE